MARVGVVTTSYPREPGDPAGNFVEGFARYLVGAGHAVEVVAAGPGATRVDGIEVARVDGRGLFYRGGAPDALGEGGGAWARAAAFQAALAMEVARRSGRWEAVVSHWVVPSALAVEATSPWRPGRVPHLAIAHSSDVWMLRRSKAGRAALRLLSTRAALTYAGAHLVVDGAPGRVVPMGIDSGACRGDGERGRRRFMLHCSTGGGGRVTALFLGRLVPVKGLDLLLAALPEEMDLLVAGDGPLRATLEALAPPRVRFLGEVRGRDKSDLLAAADLLVVPSRRLPDGREEGTPTVLLEALAAGLPIVATRTGGIEAVLDDGETALLVDPRRDALAHALRRMLDAGLRRRLREAGDGYRHDWSRIGPILAGPLFHDSRRDLVGGRGGA